MVVANTTAMLATVVRHQPHTTQSVSVVVIVIIPNHMVVDTVVAIVEIILNIYIMILMIDDTMPMPSIIIPTSAAKQDAMIMVDGLMVQWDVVPVINLYLYDIQLFQLIQIMFLI